MKQGMTSYSGFLSSNTDPRSRKSAKRQFKCQTVFIETPSMVPRARLTAERMYGLEPATPAVLYHSLLGSQFQERNSGRICQQQQ